MVCLESLLYCGSQAGAIAQLGERLHGMQEVAGSIPASSRSKIVMTVHHAVPIV